MTEVRNTFRVRPLTKAGLMDTIDWSMEVPMRLCGPAIFAVMLLAQGQALAWETRFRWPVDDPGGTHILYGMVIGFDHDPEDRGSMDIKCLDYACREDFPHCYDQHEGTDYPLDGGFDAMDAGSLPVVAGAAGEVVEAVDGNYDRCHGELGGVINCDGHPIAANYVRLRHKDGLETAYYHLKKGSVAVKVGEWVECGQFLGLMGSSGISALPHLHFQVEGPDGIPIDPYYGPCNETESLWVVQDGPGGMPGPWCQGEVVPDWAEAPSEMGMEGVEAEAGVEADAGIKAPLDAGPEEGLAEPEALVPDVDRPNPVGCNAGQAALAPVLVCPLLLPRRRQRCRGVGGPGA